MESKTATTQEQNNSKPLEVQKIEKKILFGMTGPWSRYFKALLFFGIDVNRMVIENSLLRDELVKLRIENENNLKIISDLSFANESLIHLSESQNELIKILQN